MQTKFVKQIKDIYIKLNKLRKSKKKKLIFSIGNTTKIDTGEYYFTPSRIFDNAIIFGIVVYDDKYAKIASKILDGKVDYMMVDAEKKLQPKSKIIPSNVERRVRENTKNSKLLIFKGNDLTVDSIDLFLTYYFNDDIRGLGGKKIVILGSGNIGSKLALTLLERGSKIYIYRRDFKKNYQIAKTFNFLKPKYTFENIYAVKNIEEACLNADILIGTTNGKAVINSRIINKLKNTAIIIDAGKGTLQQNALKLAFQKNIKIFRTDVTASLNGLIEKSFKMEKLMLKSFSNRKEKNYKLISQGLLGQKDDVVVDDVNNPNIIYGICNGKGDFVRNLHLKQKKIIKNIKKKYSINL